MSPPFTRSSVFRDFERGLSAGAADVVVFMSYMTGGLLLDVELHGRGLRTYTLHMLLGLPSLLSVNCFSGKRSYVEG